MISMRKWVCDHRTERQREVAAWCRETFGEFAATDRRERARRFLEEAFELVQAAELPFAEAQNILYHVYEQPPGQVHQEFGGVGLTLLCFADALNIDADEEEDRELHRVKSKSPDHFRTRHAAKIAAGISETKEKPNA